LLRVPATVIPSGCPSATAQIEEFVAAAYRKRNDYMHGDDPNAGALVLIDAGPAASLTEMVDAAELVTCRAVYRTITDTARPHPSNNGSDPTR
jgi:hypothetical protein